MANSTVVPDDVPDDVIFSLLIFPIKSNSSGVKTFSAAEEGLRSFKVTERYIKEDTWIVNAINKEEATDIAMSVDPDTSEVVEVTSTTVDYIETFDNLEKS